ncbi:MAG: type I-C CRISPR-associated protein Cas5c [Candidatus Methanomethyliaceae archaeon]
MSYPPLKLKVWGEYACFTRPEFKVERVTYPVMTPSAARGVLEAVFWKPEFQWQVRRIAVLNPVKLFSIRRNEVSRRASPQSDGFYADDDDIRTQRHSLVLRDVAYIIEADMVVDPSRSREDPAKWRDQFRRRAERGQCYHRPYLGCREFSAEFGPPDGTETPINVTEDLGLMLFDIEYGPSGNAPRFFHARLEKGVLAVPAELYQKDREGGVRQ